MSVYIKSFKPCHNYYLQLLIVSKRQLLGGLPAGCSSASSWCAQYYRHLCIIHATRSKNHARIRTSYRIKRAISKEFLLTWIYECCPSSRYHQIINYDINLVICTSCFWWQQYRILCFQDALSGQVIF